MTYQEEKKIRNLASASDSAVLVEINKLSAYRPEIARVIIAEAKKRNLAPAVVHDFEGSSGYLSDAEEVKWIRLLAYDNCKYCGDEKELVGFTNRTAVSFIRGTRVEEQLEFSCKDCARRLLKSSNRFSGLLGWWSLTGPFVTPYVLVKNYLEVGRDFEQSDNHWRTVVRLNYKRLRKEFPDMA